MTDCKGLFGKLFGHNFDTYITKRPLPFTLNISSLTDNTVAIPQFYGEYEIRCKRCGAKTDETFKKPS